VEQHQQQKPWTSAPDCVPVADSEPKEDHESLLKRIAAQMRRDYPNGVPEGQVVTGFAGAPTAHAFKVPERILAGPLFRKSPADAPTVRVQALPGGHARKRRTRTKTAARSRSSGDDGPLPPLACLGCGAGFASGGRSDRVYCDDGCRNRAKARRHRARVAADELESLARLARDAIRRGADPELTLSIVVWPPECADDARRLLGVAA
jgi:hypothetical protein